MTKNEAMKALSEEVFSCTGCQLCKKRKKAVPGEGSLMAKVMLIGEGPGHDEDVTGRPFVGPAGQLLTKMLASIGLTREEVYICNIVKCRPPENRIPFSEEAEACLPFLRRQFAIIRPKIVVCLGATAARYIIDNDIRITRDRGKWYEKGGIPMIPTYHPSALLRDESKKKEAWEDLKQIKKRLEDITEDE